MNEIKCRVVYSKPSGKYYTEIKYGIPDDVKSFEVSEYR